MTEKFTSVENVAAKHGRLVMYKYFYVILREDLAPEAGSSLNLPQ